VRRCRVERWIIQHLEAGTGLADLMRDVEQVAGRARQAIELRDDHHVARLQCLYELGELGPIASRTGISASILVQLAAVNSAC
jgi:hypothetical protein